MDKSVLTYEDWCNMLQCRYNVMPTWYWNTSQRIKAYENYKEGYGYD